MKLPISKRVYRDAMRRTRIIRIVALALAVFLSLITVSDFNGAAVTTAHVTMALTILGVPVFMLFCELVIYCFHRRRKWDMFRILPASKTEWFWSGLLAEITNLFIYAVVSEIVTAAFALTRKEMRGLIRPAFLPHIQKVILCMTIGIVFLAVFSVIREITHTPVSFFVLLVGTMGSFFAFFAMLPQVVRSLSGNIVSVQGSFIFRIRLFYRVLETMQMEADCLGIAYDWGALLLNLLIAAGMLWMGQRLAKRSETEYIGAEYRNKRLFYILMAELNLLPLLFIVYGFFIGSEQSPNVLLVPVLMGLIIYFLCHLFRMKPDRKAVFCVGFAIVFTGLLTEAAYLYSIYGKILPKREKIVAIQILGFDEGMIYQDAGIDKVYERMLADIEKPPKYRNQNEEFRIRIYTENGRKEYYISNARAEGRDEPYIRADEDGKKVFCGYGHKARIVTPFASLKEYNAFISLLPENERAEIPVYYVNALGGMSKSSQTIPVASGDFNSGAIFVDVQALNGLRGTGYVACGFNVSGEAADYYSEKVYKPQHREMIEHLRNNRDKTNNIEILLDRYSWGGKQPDIPNRWYNLNGFIGGNKLRVKLSSYSCPNISDEDGVKLYDILFGEGNDPAANEEKTRVSVYIFTIGNDNEYTERYYEFLVSSERMADLYDHFDEMLRKDEEEQQRVIEERLRQTEDEMQEGEQ